MTIEFEIVEIEVEEDVDVGFGIKDYVLPDVVLHGGDSFISQCCVRGQHL